jgi:alkylation response protein AidB-like acyl-CoA dehydrogenase
MIDHVQSRPVVCMPRPASVADDIVHCGKAIARLSPPTAEECAAAPLIAELRAKGLLQACVPVSNGGLGLAHEPGDPDLLVRLLVEIGKANLSVGRLLEGHVNALKLVALHARRRTRETLFDMARGGWLFGVWGADGPDAVRLLGGDSVEVRLSGQKLFASGADTLDLALVTARDADGATHLLAVPTATLAGRLFPEEWSVSGMKATASGRCDLEGYVTSRAMILGGPDDFFLEPWFHGGVWRYAAVQLGGMYALAAAASSQLRTQGRATAPLQAARLRRIVTACETAHLWVSAAAAATEAPAATPATAQVAVLARLKVAEEAVSVLALVDEALGASSFGLTHPAERVRRDLQFYLRQANPDGMSHSVMEQILEDATARRRWGLD